MAKKVLRGQERVFIDKNCYDVRRACVSGLNVKEHDDS